MELTLQSILYPKIYTLLHSVLDQLVFHYSVSVRRVVVPVWGATITDSALQHLSHLPLLSPLVINQEVCVGSPPTHWASWGVYAFRHLQTGARSKLSLSSDCL